jgi:hypothetical protein
MTGLYSSISHFAMHLSASTMLNIPLKKKSNTHFAVPVFNKVVTHGSSSINACMM